MLTDRNNETPAAIVKVTRRFSFLHDTIHLRPLNAVKKIDSVQEWVKESQPVVNKIQNRVGGSANAWQVVINQGHSKALQWVEEVEPLVNEIEKDVSGPTNAWQIVIGHGQQNTKEWVAEAQKAVRNIQGKVGGSSNAWLIIIDQGTQDASQWVQTNEPRASRLIEKGDTTAGAWFSVIRITPLPGEILNIRFSPADRRLLPAA